MILYFIPLAVITLQEKQPRQWKATSCTGGLNPQQAQTGQQRDQRERAWTPVGRSLGLTHYFLHLPQGLLHLLPHILWLPSGILHTVCLKIAVSKRIELIHQFLRKNARK